jgi:hypothetical protein
MRTEDEDRPQGLTGAPENQPLERLREAGKRVTDPLEATAQRIAERAIDLVIHAVDINEFVAQIDLNAVLDRIDITRLLERVDLNALLKNVDLNALIQRVDVEALVTHTDFGEIIAKQTSGIASGMDGAIDRGVWRLLRRNAPRRHDRSPVAGGRGATPRTG